MSGRTSACRSVSVAASLYGVESRLRKWGSCGVLSDFVDAGDRAVNIAWGTTAGPMMSMALEGITVVSDVRTPCHGFCSQRGTLRATLFLTIGFVAMLLSGCAIYTPYQVFRFTADYNTERRASFQAEVFEHVPSRTVRVRMNRWAYNVGPQPTTASIPIPSTARVTPVPIITSPPASTPPAAAPGDGRDLLEESQPPVPVPPVPRTDLRSEEPGGRFGPSARANNGVRGASYEVPRVMPPNVPSVPTPTGAWLFSQ